MASRFDTMVADLGKQLGLPALRAAGPGSTGLRVDLRIDGVSIELTEAPDGRSVVVRGTLGPLAADPARRAEQVRRLLRDGLGLMSSSTAGLVVEEAASGAPMVRAVATYAYRHRLNPRLIRAIEEVTEACERHAALFADADPRGGPNQRLAPDSDAVIFRP